MDFSAECPNINSAPPDAGPKAPAPVDAAISVSITDGGLQAYLNIKPPLNGGAAPTLEALESALSAQGICYNVNSAILKHLASCPVYNKDINIASGTEPVDGTDGTATLLIKTEKTGKPKITANDKADFYNLDIVENVKQGQILCNITLPTEGRPGISVQGKELPQRKGRPVRSLAGRNTELSEDGTAVISKINGQVDFDGRKINVADTFYVKGNVDNSTGNIIVAGNLVISGMVLPGFKVEAGGFINISGAVENASITAAGNITLQSGVIASALRCGGDLKCRYIENSDVFVKNDIKTESIINSNVKCGNNIRLTGPIAKIIGGSCMAGQNIEASTIGSEFHTKALLKIGTDAAVIERQHELLTQVSELEAQNKKLQSLLDILRQLEAANRLTPESRQALNSADYSYKINAKSLEEAKAELDDIAETISKKGFGRINCTGVLYPGTRVEIGNACLVIKDTRKNVSLYFHEGEICIGAAR